MLKWGKSIVGTKSFWWGCSISSSSHTSKFVNLISNEIRETHTITPRKFNIAKEISLPTTIFFKLFSFFFAENQATHLFLRENHSHQPCFITTFWGVQPQGSVLEALAHLYRKARKTLALARSWATQCFFFVPKKGSTICLGLDGWKYFFMKKCRSIGLQQKVGLLSWDGRGKKLLNWS